MQRNCDSKAIAKNNSARLLTLPDCIHLTENGKCNVLDVAFCKGEDCSFLQTDAREASQKVQWKEKMCELDETQQRVISRKYYGGAMPWKEEEPSC